MATNKRKDAAALFELIDKSTLKVPKNAGALRIPSWWTSKSNPATAAEGERPEGTTPVQTNGQVHRPTAPLFTATPASESAAVPQNRIHSPEAPPAPLNGVAAAPETTARTEAGPSGVSAVHAPRSIRPPAPQPPVTAAIRSAPLPTEMPVAPKETAPIPEAEAADEARGSHAEMPKVFAPQTRAQGRTSWGPPRAGSFARMPAWVLLSGVAGAVVVIICLVMLLHGKTGSTSGSTPIARGGGAGGGSAPAQPSIIPRAQTSQPPPMGPVSMGRGQGAPPRIEVNPGFPTADYVGTGGGHMWAPGKISGLRVAGQLYIVIATTPSGDIAERNAKFLADSGIDVSIETQYPRGKLLYTLVSAEGFPTAAAAEPLRARIVKIGHELPEYKRTHRAWDDAYVIPISPKTAPAG